jgi:hypothetical protein
MKRIFLFTALAAVAVACTKVDNGKITYTTHQIEASHTFDVPLSATRADTVEVRTTLLLSDVLDAPYIARLLKARLTDGSVAIEGLSALGRNLSLDSLCITVKDRENKIFPDQNLFYFGNIAADKVIAQSPAKEFLQSLFFCFDNHAKNLDLTVYYVSTDAFSEAEDVRLVVRFNGTFDYAEFN